MSDLHRVGKLILRALRFKPKSTTTSDDIKKDFTDSNQDSTTSANGGATCDRDPNLSATTSANGGAVDGGSQLDASKVSV